jgi:hypothetical protein
MTHYTSNLPSHLLRYHTEALNHFRHEEGDEFALSGQENQVIALHLIAVCGDSMQRAMGPLHHDEVSFVTHRHRSQPPSSLNDPVFAAANPQQSDCTAYVPLRI